jgi:hypothetical protein
LNHQHKIEATLTHSIDERTMVSPLRPSSSSLPLSSSDPLNHHHQQLYPSRIQQQQQQHLPSRSINISNRRAASRKGPLWIGAGILVLVPLFILNLQLWLYQDPEWQGDHLVETQHWRPPSRILAETETAKCVQWESTGQLVWVQRDTVQILVVDAEQHWWFVPNDDEAAAATTAQQQTHNRSQFLLKLVQGPIQWPPPPKAQPKEPQPPPDQQLYKFTSGNTWGGGAEDVGPWHAAQRVVQEHWGIPSHLLRITDYEGYQEGKVPPLAQDHWKFLGRMPLMTMDQHQHSHQHVEAGEFSGYLYTYLWKVQSPPNRNTDTGGSPNAAAAVALSSLVEVQRAIAQQRFRGMRSLASLALAVASSTTSTSTTLTEGKDGIAMTG